MDNLKVIQKDPGLTNDQNYAFLRSAGLSYIEGLGSKLWTDYNEHDPGITILEALCFAITELGYRTGLPMQDLLTGPDGKISSSQPLYTAKNILTQSPLNIDDYRKLLIDIVGVHNAWLLIDDSYTIKTPVDDSGESLVFADCMAVNTTAPPVINLSGLFNVLLDLENDQQFGDLNNGELSVLNPANANFQSGLVSLTVIFKPWNDPSVVILLTINPINVTNASGVFLSADNNIITISFSYVIDATTYDAQITAIVDVDQQPAGRSVVQSDLKDFFSPEFTSQVLNLYLLKIQQSKKIVQTAIRALQENRNLCEDFVSVTTIKDEEIAICCDIDIAPSADMEAIQAQVFFAIEEYFDPSVNFYLLSEMQAKGYTTDEIFEGPVLTHGFIDTDELEQTQLRDEIYASDIISLIMDIDGVLAARNFMMTKYGDDDKPDPNAKGKSWCMPISAGCKPVFSETKSKILFYKNQFPYLPSLPEVRDTLRSLRAVKARNKLTGHTDDLAIPPGTYSPLDDYSSIAYLLPQTYGVGPAGLPATADDTRKGQAKQLQAYILLYDQLLADYCSQLKNARELFSTDNITHSYNAQFLDDMKDVLPVYKQDKSGHTIKDLVMNKQNSVAALNPWQKLYESNELFLDRRNRFQDHLMSRFGESFNEYVLMMNYVDEVTQQVKSIDPATLIKNKTEFLKDYPVMSYQRGRAFNYFPQYHFPPNPDFTIDTTKFWDTDNVSGLERKLSRLGGLDTYLRKFLYCIGSVVINQTSDTPAKYQFVYTYKNGDSLTSVTAYNADIDAMNIIPLFIDMMLAGKFSIKQTGANYNVYVLDKTGANLAISNNFTSADAASAARSQFIADFNNDFNDQCDVRGLHLIEHILLRPRGDVFPLSQASNCDFCRDEDPYSFKMSVVLPYWPAQFRNMAFRSYFEDIIREEVPAHTMVKVCWINDQSLYDFESAYKAWITALANYAAGIDLTALEPANDKLMSLLFSLHNEYPVATLHDCDESKDTNPVMLGKTILGS